MGQLSHEGAATGVIFGMFRDLKSMQEMHRTDNTVFAFDLGQSFRCNLYPGYKAKRKEKRELETQEEKKARRELETQIRLLRTEYLEYLGYKNILAQDGFEADDIIASVCQSLPKKDEAILVSTDKDLYQLLSPKVCIWNPTRGKLLTEQWLSKEFGITPKQWIDVKALSGCSTDEVIGIRGVGEVTAIKYLLDKLSEKSKAYDKIECEAGRHTWKKNMPLVEIPYPGCPVFKLRDDELSSARWAKLTSRLGMKSLEGSSPKDKNKWRFGLNRKQEGLLDG